MDVHNPTRQNYQILQNITVYTITHWPTNANPHYYREHYTEVFNWNSRRQKPRDYFTMQNDERHDGDIGSRGVSIIKAEAWVREGSVRSLGLEFKQNKRTSSGDLPRREGRLEPPPGAVVVARTATFEWDNIDKLEQDVAPNGYDMEVKYMPRTNVANPLTIDDLELWDTRQQIIDAHPDDIVDILR